MSEVADAERGCGGPEGRRRKRPWLKPGMRPWIGMLLRRANRQVDALFEELVASSGLSRREFLVLAGAVFDGPASQRRISERLQIDRSTMTEIVDRLEERGLVERLPDPEDRRAYRLTATPTGEHLILEEYQHVPAEVDARLLQPLSEEERETLRRILMAVAGPPPWKRHQEQPRAE